MSRNKQQGKYAGHMNGKAYRSKAVSVQPSTLDCIIHVQWKEMQHNKRIMREFLSSGGMGQLGFLLRKFI